jgi:hypothetical protein
MATNSNGSVICLFLTEDDDSNRGYYSPYGSGDEITLSYKWLKQGTYTIKVKAKDPYDEEGSEGTFTVYYTKKQNNI